MRTLLLLVLLGVALAGCGGDDNVEQSDQDKASSQALILFQKAQNSGQDLNNGPCLAEHIPGAEDWAADIAHDPRQPVDNDLANQCSSYRDGQTHHFVELTPDGQLIKTR